MRSVAFAALVGCGPAASVPTPCVPDVPAAFAAIGASPTITALADADALPDPIRYSRTADNDWGIDNHLQGVARDGRWLFVSGGDVKVPQADLLVADLHHQRFVGTIPLDEGGEWHAGGIAVFEGLLAVPTEELREASDERTASIRLIDVRDPRRPRRVAVLDQSPVAHATGLTRHGDGLLLVSWDDSSLTFFRGDADVGFVRFATVPVADIPTDVEEVGSAGVTGQGVSLIQGCDDTPYALFTDNTRGLPIAGGVDHADLVRVDIDGDAVTLTLVGSRAFICPTPQQCHFSAGGGAWVDPAGGVHIAGVPHYHDAVARVLPWASFGTNRALR